MKKTMLIGALCALFVVPSLSAQEIENKQAEEKVEAASKKEKSQKPKMERSWFLNGGVGALMYFGDHDRQLPFGERIGPAVEASFGKWFNTWMGMRAAYSGCKIYGSTQNYGLDQFGGVRNDHVNVEGKDGWGSWLQRSSYPYMNLHVDFVFNANSILAGYKADRFYTLVPYVGFGYCHAFRTPCANSWSVNGGLIHNFRLSRVFDLYLAMNGTLVDDKFDGEPGGRSGEGIASVNFGLNFKF